jgi:mannose-1-phosphate guanylyltransferase
MKIIIFCGGSGTRMWPMSRDKYPKQFQPMIGNLTVFRQVINRLLKGYSISDIYISTTQKFADTIISEVPELPRENLILEPEKRDTLACVGYAISIVNEKYPNCIIASMWSDHYVRNDEEFIKAFQTAEKIAQQENVIVNIDAKPTFPNVSLGYMEIGKLIKEVNGFSVFQFVRQIEKPDLEHAKQFVRSYKYLWHTGFKVFKSDLLLNLYKKYAPETYEIYKNILKNKNNAKFVVEEYAKIPKTSVDFGIYEKIKEGGIVEIPADLGFSDIGLWNVLKDELAENGKALVVKGDSYDIGSIDCLIYELSRGKVIATIGCENLIIVDTPDALLVASKFKAQEVKKIVEKLKEEGKEQYL